MTDYDIHLQNAEHFLALARLDLKSQQTTNAQDNLLKADTLIDQVLVDIDLKELSTQTKALGQDLEDLASLNPQEHTRKEKPWKTTPNTSK